MEDAIHDIGQNKKNKSDVLASMQLDIMQL